MLAAQSNDFVGELDGHLRKLEAVGKSPQEQVELNFALVGAEFGNVKAVV